MVATSESDPVLVGGALEPLAGGGAGALVGEMAGALKALAFLRIASSKSIPMLQTGCVG
ncbi:hypothetical protein AB0758_45580 [Tolypothrix bouteillei VB521301_2]|uniref:hypothetical protein n=1 Tax=Tolypothrix bouteillei TaxID=1246981 RepID=UPI0038B67E59